MATNYIHGFDEKIWNNHSACQNELIYLKNKNDNLLDQIGELRKEIESLKKENKKKEQEYESDIKKLNEEITKLNKHSAITRHLEIAKTYHVLKSYGKTAKLYDCDSRTVRRAVDKFPHYK